MQGRASGWWRCERRSRWGRERNKQRRSGGLPRRAPPPPACLIQLSALGSCTLLRRALLQICIQ